MLTAEARQHLASLVGLPHVWSEITLRRKRGSVMAQKVVVEMVDDLDGTVGEGVTTVTFGLDGRSYEIELTSKNAEKLRDGLAAFVAGARRGSTRAKSTVRSGPRQSAAARERSHAIREWARGSGLDVAERGRIPASVIEAYEQAQRVHEVAQPKAATKKSSAKKQATELKQPAFSG